MRIRAWISRLGWWMVIFSAIQPQFAFAQRPARPEPPLTSRPAQTLAPTGKLTNALRIAQGFTNGLVHVIVNLVPRQSLRNADFSSRTSLAAIRAENRRAQQEVLDHLPA